MVFFTSWDIEDIGPLVGLLDPATLIQTNVTAVNNSGIVAGTAVVGNQQHGFLIDDTAVTDITPTAVDSMSVADINADGFTIGSLTFPGNLSQAFVRDPGGSLSILQGLGGFRAFAGGITANGAIAGGQRVGNHLEALRWGPPAPNGTTIPVSLHQPDLTSTKGQSINDNLEVAGEISDTVAHQSAVYDGTQWIGISNASFQGRHYINSGGVVAAGNFFNVTLPGAECFFYEKGVRIPLRDGSWPAVRPEIQAVHGLSDDGTVVGEGFSMDPPPHLAIATTWSRKSLAHDLNGLIPPNSGWRLQAAVAISPNGGFVVGFGVLNSERRIFRIRRGIEVSTLRLPEVPHEWPFWILGSRLDEGGIRIGPQGPIPIPPWTGSAWSATGGVMSDALRMLALHELTAQVQDPDLRRKLQPLLMKAIIERLKAIEDVSGIESRIRRIKVKRSPSKVEPDK